MSRRRAPVPAWPFLLALTCLFVLAVTAPRGWEQVARRRVLLGPDEHAARKAQVTVSPEPVPLAPPRAIAVALESPAPTLAPKINLAPSPTLAIARSTRLPLDFDQPPRPTVMSNASLILTTPDDEVKPEVRPTPLLETKPAKPIETAAKVRWWPVPHDLLAELERLAQFPEARRSAHAVRDALAELADVEGPNDPRAAAIVERLDDLAAEQNVLLPLIPEGPRATSFRRAGLALVRRIDVWQHVPSWPTNKPQTMQASLEGGDSLARCLREIDATYAKQADAKPNRLLMLEALHELVERYDSLSIDERQRLAGFVLARLDRAGVDAETEGNRNDPLVRLHDLLRPIAAAPVDPRQMIFDIECFEHSGLQTDARRVAENYQRLSWAEGRQQQKLAENMTAHYRNANLRVTFSLDLMNRLVQAQPPRETYVRDVVLGNPTRGWSTTWTDASFRLIPDSNRARLLLEARGRVSADMVTIASIVRLRSESDSAFVASKELEIGLSGLRSQPARADSSTTPRLRSVETDLDLVPVLGLVAQSFAEASFEDNQERARIEARRKLSRRIREEMDKDLASRIERANAKFSEAVLGPLNNLDLSPELIEAQTTEQRITLRMRLATDEQLAGHGPRPRAPGDSIASAQIHQSLLNNVCEQFQWDGKTFTLPELREDLAAKLNREIDAGAAAEHQDLSITFANENAIRLRCADGRIEINLAIAQLKIHRETWRDFAVRVYYKPNLSTPEGTIERDGSVQLIGDRLGPKAQLALRSIFSKIFSQSRQINILPPNVTTWRPGLANLSVCQFDIDDEWVALAFATRPAVVKQARK